MELLSIEESLSQFNELQSKVNEKSNLLGSTNNNKSDNIPHKFSYDIILYTSFLVFFSFIVIGIILYHSNTQSMQLSIVPNISNVHNQSIIAVWLSAVAYCSKS